MKAEADIAGLSEALLQTGQEVGAYFSALPTAAFFEGDDERWSPAHHLAHLTLSNTPVASALGLPKGRLARVSADQPPRTAQEVGTMYVTALARGVKATGRFLPSPHGTPSELLERYDGSVHLLDHNLIYWMDGELNDFALPHPVLGSLSVREMLYFTVLHNQHHLNGVKARLKAHDLT